MNEVGTYTDSYAGRMDESLAPAEALPRELKSRCGYGPFPARERFDRERNLLPKTKPKIHHERILLKVQRGDVTRNRGWLMALRSPARAAGSRSGDDRVIRRTS